MVAQIPNEEQKKTIAVSKAQLKAIKQIMLDEDLISAKAVIAKLLENYKKK